MITFVTRRFFLIYSIAFLLLIPAGCDVGGSGVLEPEEGEALSGGDVTIFDESVNAFGFPAPGLARQEELFFGVGNSFFNQNWVQSPASTTARDGLGPVFNARSCAGCHFKDGRGRSPAFDGESPTGYLVRLGVPGGLTPLGEPVADARYGTQIQDNSILGVETEATVILQYEEVAGTFGDGTPYVLRRPVLSFQDEAFGPIEGLAVSPRVANQMPGLGLLEAIPEASILAYADPSDANGDGISGRPNQVWNFETASYALGRFGWKGEQPTIRQQVASAFIGDMGITSSIFPNQNCAQSPSACSDAPGGGTPEIEDRNLAHVELYASTLAVPGRRNWDAEEVLAGKQLFNETGCAGCHVPVFETGISTVSDALSNQTIRPYTDLLLHDMGPGLADGLSTFEANGQEWRTPPLWGIGLISTVNRHTELLHDGRARDVVEAILWHGGEAEQAKEKFRNLNQQQRDNLVAFLHSL
ncbi:MAG: di-heme oxidoredictase family protein [Bacteroidota bacterium]